jgi:glutathione synthase
MSLSIAFQMDPLDSINIDGDSSFVLALEAQKRGYKLFHYLPAGMSYENGVLRATGHSFTVRREKGSHFSFGPQEARNLDQFDLILMRQDPPFDMAYITASHMLEMIQDRVLILNDPREVRNAPEKIMVLEYADLMPPTLISKNRQEIEAFRAKHKDIILKPLYGNGGAQIFRVPEGSDNLPAFIEMFGQIYREPIMVQKYIPEIRQGDKRIILIDGEPAGALMRIPPDGEARANLHVGGKPVKTDLTPRDLEICDRLKPELKRRKLVFTGIDVIGDYLTEINVTSPTGLQEINRLNGVNLEAQMWDAYERHIKAFQKTQKSRA